MLNVVATKQFSIPSISNQSTFESTFTIDEVIEDAYERCGVQGITGYQLKTARRSMNLMFAEWANRGLNLWTVTYATQTLTAGTNYYSIDFPAIYLILCPPLSKNKT